MKILFAAALAVSVATATSAQTPVPADKPTVAKYLADGYTVLRSDIGNPFLQFILQKSTATGQVLVWCSVQIQNGETSSCRTIK
jgi:hypothetical protein